MERFEYECDGLIIRESNEAAKRDILTKPLTQAEINELKTSVKLRSGRLKWQFGICCTLAVGFFIFFLFALINGYRFMESLAQHLGVVSLLAVVASGTFYAFGAIKLQKLSQTVCGVWNGADLEFNGLTLVRCKDDEGINLLKPAKPEEFIKLAEILRDPGNLETGIRLFLATVKQEREITSLEVHLCLALSQVLVKREEFRLARDTIAGVSMPVCAEG